MKIEIKKTVNGLAVRPEDILNILLEIRGIKDPDKFFQPKPVNSMKLEDFGFKNEIKRTLNKLEEIKTGDKPIVVYTDYDADGITGGTILWETLHLLGFKTMPYVPHRKKEGYGFSRIGIDNVKKQFNPALIISVDHGITAKDEIEYAKRLGIPVIVTDHHLKPENPPDNALAVFHLPELSGAGVSYFFSKMVFEHFAKKTSEVEEQSGKNSEVKNLKLLIANFEVDYLFLAAIGIVADLVPLTGPARSVVIAGLAAANSCRRCGLREIIKQSGIENRKITPYEIGFVIAPRINAVGRLDNAIDALRLLCTTDPKRATELTAKVGSKNRERQDLVKAAVVEAVAMVDRQVTQNKELPKVIILKSEDWHEGIIGLIASKIAEKYYRPTIVLTKNDGFYKASARSIPGFDITGFLRGLEKHLVDVGGHSQAAGFTIEEAKLAKFIKTAEKEADKLLDDRGLEKKITADLSMPLSVASIRLVNELEKLQPFGVGNPQPVFFSRAEIIDARLFGRKNEHLKIWVKDPEKQSFPLELISFGSADIYQTLQTGKVIDIVYKLEIDRWSGRENLRGIVIHLSN